MNKLPDKGQLYFKVSSGLKRIIGRDLIVSDFVALFELVKNSFDAHAKNVQIVFEDEFIWVIDNGKSMSSLDLLSKWLFLGYSAKRDGSEDRDYRGQRHGAGAFAGNKGIGRFSCDRLGVSLTLQAKTSKQERVDVIEVDWDKFEKNDKNEFINIPVKHTVSPDFDLPEGVRLGKHGTVLRIGKLRENWHREKILELKSHLTKLINPFDGLKPSFSLELISQRDSIKDSPLRKQLSIAADEDKVAISRLIVNGPIENFIFRDIASKTTRIEVKCSTDGKRLLTELMDRDRLIYSIEEPNPFPLLAKADFSCRLFSLNQSAKMTFARRMGVPSVKFGSVFLYRNEFRVFPIGEEGDDTFGIDARKQQGYARFLGTRDLIGRIDVHGDETLFQEPSSRDQGLIQTPAYKQMVMCFSEKCLKRLERYVVGVTWKDSLDKLREDSSGLSSSPARARIIELVSDLVSTRDIVLLDYSHELVDVLSDKVEQFESSLNDLKEFAKATGDGALVKRINAAEKRYQELKEAEARAKDIAEKEREARQEAELKVRKVVAEKVVVQAALEEEKKRTLFLSAVSSLDVETVTNMHHQITICAADIHELIEVQIEKLNSGKAIEKDSLFSFLEQMRLKNQQVLAIARMATKANFRMASDEITEDLASFVVQYLYNISAVYQDRIRIIVDEPKKAFVRSFKPIEWSIVIDNLVNNARKAESPDFHASFDSPSTTVLRISFTDHGNGLAAVITEPGRIFDKGVSTTDGSGLGLYHVRQIIEAMGGSIIVTKPAHTGARFEITLPKT